MKEVFVNHSISYLIRNNACKEKDVPVYRYTLESLYSLFTKTVGVLFLSFFCGTLKITFIIMLLYSLLRGFAFGIHATKNLYCWITTLGIYLGSSLFIKYFSFPLSSIYFIYFLSFLFLFLWAPADTPSRPLLNKKKRITNKMISLIIVTLYILFSIIISNDNFYEIIGIVLLLEAICICPLTYNNYKSYKK